MSDETEFDERVSAERRAFLDAAFEKHFGFEIARDIPAVIETFAKGGHLQFNGVMYDTPEKLEAFHVGFANVDTGVLKNLGGNPHTRLYTHDSVIVEFHIEADVNRPLGDEKPGRRATWTGATVYQFDEAGMLVSERAYLDTGGLMPEPVIPVFR